MIEQKNISKNKMIRERQSKIVNLKFEFIKHIDLLSDWIAAYAYYSSLKKRTKLWDELKKSFDFDKGSMVYHLATKTASELHHKDYDEVDVLRQACGVLRHSKDLARFSEVNYIKISNNLMKYFDDKQDICLEDFRLKVKNILHKLFEDKKPVKKLDVSIDSNFSKESNTNRSDGSAFSQLISMNRNSRIGLIDFVRSLDDKAAEKIKLL